MPCTVVMDLRPIESKVTLAKSGVSATLQCSFAGKYTPPPKSGAKSKPENTVQIEVLITSRSGLKSLKNNIPEIEAIIASGSLLRVTGTLHRLMYQDRSNGEEIDKLRLFAFDISPSPEKSPIFSIVQMEGGVRKISDTEIYKVTERTTKGKGAEGSVLYRKATFNLFSAPAGGNDKESYLTVYVNGFNDVADWVNHLNLKEGSHVMANGRLEATSFGPLCLVLHDLRYATRPQTEKE